MTDTINETWWLAGWFGWQAMVTLMDGQGKERRSLVLALICRLPCQWFSISKIVVDRRVFCQSTDQAISLSTGRLQSRGQALSLSCPRVDMHVRQGDANPLILSGVNDSKALTVGEQYGGTRGSFVTR